MDVRTLAVLWATSLSLLASDAAASFCPSKCMCSTTIDGLHKAICSNVEEFKAYVRDRDHSNINILDLSHNNISRLNFDLDRLPELVSLDLSTNGFSEIYPGSIYPNLTKLVHLNLANNRILTLEMSNLPARISSLDLSNNLMQDIPSDLQSLPYLEHLQLDGNPIDCSCKNILSRDYLLINRVAVDYVKCATPLKFKGKIWYEIKKNLVCSPSGNDISNMPDNKNGLVQELVVTNEDGFLLNFKPAQTLVDLDKGKSFVDVHNNEDEDDVVFLRIKRQQPNDNIEGSGNDEGSGDQNSYYTTDSTLNQSQMEDEEILQKGANTFDDHLEGSGEGSGFGAIISNSENENDYDTTITPVTPSVDLYTNHINPFFGNSVLDEDTEIPLEILPQKPNIFMGPDDWFNTTTPQITTLSTTTVEPIEEPGGAEKMQIKTTLSEKTSETKEDEQPNVHRTGTYVCVVIIVVLLIGLIGFAIVKGQMRRRRDRRMQRQQKRDVERASREMVDMNTSLLGKPAPTITIADKRTNGKYELVPTHEPTTKKAENGNVTSSHDPNKGSPRDSNQNREERPSSLVLPSASAASPENKQRGSLSSDEIFVPDSEGPTSSGVKPSDATQPHMNGANTNDSDYLSPSREYVPVYSPDMGRVRIKLTETPKPKTPVLVTRSRSNAGDIIVTPSVEQSISKPTT